MKAYRIIVQLLMMVLSVGCTQMIFKKPPYYLSSDFEPVASQHIVVMAPFNIGIDKSLDTDINKMNIIKKSLEHRGYKVSVHTGNLPSTEVIKYSLNKLDFSWLKEGNIEHGAWVMIVAVDYLDRSTDGIGIRGNAYVTGYLVEYASKKLLWEGVGYGFSKAGVFLAAIVDDDAFLFALNNLIIGVPPVEASIADKKVRLVKPAKAWDATVVSGSCDKPCGVNVKYANVCVSLDKKSSLSSEREVNGITIKNHRILYDGIEPKGDLVASGHYLCWQKEAGKTLIRINNGRPIYFRAQAGTSYHIHYTFNFFGGWKYAVLSSEQGKDILLDYIDASNVDTGS